MARPLTYNIGDLGVGKEIAFPAAVIKYGRKAGEFETLSIAKRNVTAWARRNGKTFEVTEFISSIDDKPAQFRFRRIA